jgi:NADH dehydrogenase
MRRTKATTTAIGGAAIGATLLGWKLWKEFSVRKANRRLAPNRNIVILGAGFAGLNTARELAKLLPGQDHGRITLVDRNNFLLFTPMLTEVAGGELDARHIVGPPRRISRRVDFEQGRVQAIDLANKSVIIETEPGEQRTVTADHIVIALGSVPKYHGIPGLQQYSLSMKSVGDAVAIRNRVLGCLERASGEQDAERRREMLTFVVGGGGFTGVETMAALNDLARASTKDYPRLSPDEIATWIIDPGERLLTELDADLASFARRKLEEHGVKILLNTKITGAGKDFVELEGGRRIATRTLVWAGGVTPNPLIEKLNCRRGQHGGIVVDGCCAVPDHPGVWAIGDCAEIPKPGGHGTYAPTAQNATREGATVARNIVAAMRGEKPQRFAFETIGELALVGRHAGVGQLYGRQFSGFLAWAMWRAVYLSKMPGMAQRSRILLDWILDAVFGRNIAELPLDRQSR